MYCQHTIQVFILTSEIPRRIFYCLLCSLQRT